MAFSTSNLVARNAGSTRVLSGNWSCLAGDAPGTVVIGSGSIVNQIFEANTTSSPAERPLVSTSTTNGQTTLTVYHHQTITNGRFRIEF